MRSYRTAGENAAEIPTSSMADIAFLLIIYFMLTVTFSASKGLDFGLPREDSDRPIEPVEAVLVEILPGGGLLVDRRPMALGELLAYLAPKLERNPAKPVLLRPASGSSYGEVVAVYEELRKGRDVLGLADEITISLPTQREAAYFEM